MLLAESFIDLLPPFSAGTVLVVLGCVALGVMVLRWILGPANDVSKQWTLWSLRGVILAVVLVVIFNPVRVDHLPGPFQRPEMFYLLDTSLSMRNGNPRSRWDETLDFVKGASRIASTSPVAIKPFRFGQRLAAIEDATQVGLPAHVADVSTPKKTATPEITPVRHNRSVEPNDADTRMLTALRQISSRFGRVPPQGIVLFSDGRSHDEAGIDQLAAEFARLKVPIHVVPVGDLTRGGDVAVSAVVDFQFPATSFQ